MRIAIWLCSMLVLVIAGVYLVGLSARERSEISRSALVSDSMFQGLEACDVPGLRERIIGRGNHTTAYAGEFKRVTPVPWVTGTSKIFLYVLAGNGTVMIGNATLPAKAGDFFQLPAGIRHAVRAQSNTLRAVYVEDEL